MKTTKYTRFLSYQKIEPGLLAVRGRGLSLRRHIRLPGTVCRRGKKCRVIAVAYNAFTDDRRVRRLTIAPEIEIIGDAAFAGCRKLKRVEFSPSSDSTVGTRRLGDRAFAGCAALKEVEVAATVSQVGKQAFADCKRLRHVRFLGLGTRKEDTVAPDAFHDCPRLEGVAVVGRRGVITLHPSADEGFALPVDDWRDGLLYEDNWLVTWEGPRDRDFMLSRDTVGIAPDAFALPDGIPAHSYVIELDYPLTHADWNQIQKPRGKTRYTVKVKTLDDTFEEMI